MMIHAPMLLLLASDADPPYRPAVHLTTVVVMVTVMAVVSWYGRRLRLRDPDSEKRLRIGLGWFGLAVWLGSTIYWLHPLRTAVETSLPLHVCDVLGLIAPFALLMRWRWSRAVLYFWGIGLSTQAFVMPVINHGPDSSRYWVFWLTHLVLVGFAVYDLIAAGFRPDRRDLLTAAGLMTAYFVIVFAIDAVFGLNYGYIGATDDPVDQPGLVRALGDWPLRLIPMTLIVASLFVVLWLPWGLVRRGRGRRDASVA